MMDQAGDDEIEDDVEDTDDAGEDRVAHNGKHPGRFDGEPWGRQPGESVQAYEAFEIYIALGNKRSLRGTAREVGKSRPLIERWSRRWAWIKRSEMYDVEQMRLWQADLAVARKEMAQRQLRHAVALQDLAMRVLKKKFGESFEKLDENAMKSGDLLKYLIEASKLERIVLGEPGEIVEGQITGGTPDSERKPLTPLTFSGRIDEALALVQAVRERASLQSPGAAD